MEEVAVSASLRQTLSSVTVMKLSCRALEVHCPQAQTLWSSSQ